MGIIKNGKELLGTFLKAPATSRYPVGGLRLSDASRGNITIDETRCTLCGLCARRCPAGALRTQRLEEQLLMDRMRCIVCGECVDCCPQKALEMAPEYLSPESSILIDVYNVKAVPGSGAVLDGIEMPPEEDEFPAYLQKRMLGTRELQRKRRDRIGSNGANGRKSRARYRSKRHQ